MTCPLHFSASLRLLHSVARKGLFTSGPLSASFLPWRKRLRVACGCGVQGALVAVELKVSFPENII
jgi:hypothetical protein